MIIYGDILFLVNLYVDYFLLLAVKRFLHLRATRPRLALGALLGAVFSLLSLLPLSLWLSTPLSMVFAALIVLLAFSPKDRFALFKATACFFCFSLIFGGIVLFLSQLTGRAAVVSGSVYFDISPLFLFLFTLLAYFLSLLLERVRGGHEPDRRFCKILVRHGEEEAELLAKIDTGNNLKEPFSDLPVLVAERAALAALTSGLSPQSFRLVPFTSLGGQGLLPAFRPDYICQKGSDTPLQCYLALYTGKLSAGSWNCLIGPTALVATTKQGDDCNHETAPVPANPLAKASTALSSPRTLSLHQRAGNSARPPFSKG